MKTLRLLQNFAAGHKITPSSTRLLLDEGLLKTDEYGSLIISDSGKQRLTGKK